jgi:LysR family glycine cleavage system transcriptional activator
MDKLYTRVTSLITMKLRDVPLSFLPTFEAAGRLGSFAAAAAELHLTPSAISQQIRALEDAIGVPLFERSGRTAMLTRAGESYLLEVRQSLGELAASTSRLQRRTEGSVLRMSTVALAAHEFLLPRLAAFRDRFPSVELRIETSNECVDFRVTDFDAALRVGEGWPDVTCHLIGDVELAPVCSHELAREIHSVADLTRYTLLDQGGLGQLQLSALQAKCGVPQLPAANTWRFETCFEALRAAEHGLVAFAVFPVATSWVSSARLSVPLADRLPISGRVWFVHREHDESRFPFRAMADWLRAQHEALPMLPAGRIMAAS